MFKNSLLIASIAVLIVSCSTKVDLNDDWKDTTIIYGLMDQNEEYHFVRINKAFLGDGNYYDYALIADSSEYASLNTYVEELFNGVVVETYPLRDTLLTNKETDGIFYSPEHTVYYFKKTGLDETHQFRLTAIINEGTPAEKIVTGETTLIPSFSIVNMNSIAVGTYDVSTSTALYNNPSVKFVPPAEKFTNAFEIVWRLKWDEYSATDTVRKVYNWLVGSVNRDALNSSGQIQFEVSGEAFYRTIASACGNNPSVTKRIFRAVDVVVYAANKDLETYINVNKPYTGIVQERPEYTNISNGLGIFASRIHVTMPNKHLGFAQTSLLVRGPHTNGLNFCTDSTTFIITDPALGCM